MKKKKILDLAKWGDTLMSIDIIRCKKCEGMTENLHALGVLSLCVCRKCKKFYGLEISDVTSLLHKDFKRKTLENSQNK